jgi:hypothetical protein
MTLYIQKVYPSSALGEIIPHQSCKKQRQKMRAETQISVLHGRFFILSIK